MERQFTVSAWVPTTIPATGISLSPSSLTLTVGDRSGFSATVSPSNATNRTVTWSSSNTSVAGVTNAGMIIANNPGTATITARTHNGHTASRTVTVRVPSSGGGSSSNATIITQLQALINTWQQVIITTAINNLVNIISSLPSNINNITQAASNALANGINQLITAMNTAIAAEQALPPPPQQNHWIVNALIGAHGVMGTPQARAQTSLRILDMALLNRPGNQAITANTNFQHNNSLTFGWNRIDNQRDPPARDVRMGSIPGMNTGNFNGCSWIAVYNALLTMNIRVHPANIVHRLETRTGTIAMGALGAYPQELASTLRHWSNAVVVEATPPNLANMDNAIRNSRVSILGYAHTTGAHYVAIVPLENGRFRIWNGGGHSPSNGIVDSIHDWIRNHADITFPITLITAR